MAERYYTAASGNWSTTANWDGGVSLPGSGDDVFANGKSITVDQDITCVKITTAAGTTAVAGGSFNVSTTRTFNCNVTAGTTACLIVTGTATTTINGNITGGGSAAAYGVQTSTSGASTVNVTGNVTGGTNATAYGIRGANAGTQGCALTVTGNVSAATANGIEMTIQASAGGSITVHGNVTGSNTTSSTYGIQHTTGTGNVTIDGGTLSGGSATSGHGFNASSGSTGTLTLGTIGSPISVNGGSGNASCGASIGAMSLTAYANLTGGTNAIANIGAGINVNSGSHGTITITGNISGSASGALTNAGLSIQTGNAASAITINGDITAGAASHGLYIQTTAAVVTTVNGSVIGNARGTGSSDAVAYAVNVTSTQPITKVRAAKCGANGMWPISGPCFISNIHQGSVKVRNSLLNEGVYELPRPRSNGMGDYQIGDVIYRHYTFRTTPSSLTVAVYPDDSTAEITTGVTVTYSSGFDGVAGLVSIKVDTATGYTAGKDYSIVATGGTVYGDAVAGTVLGGFSLAKQTMQAVKTKTDNLPSDPADASDIASSFSTVNSTLSTIAGYIDTEVAAIKAKTDNLPSDPADASDIAAAFSTVNGTLSTIAGYVDTEISAIKTKTDNLPADTATVLTDLPKNVWNFDLLANIATTVNRYSPWNAMRHIVCKWSIASTTKTVYKEDGTTSAYTTTVTSDATGITGDTP